VGVREVRWDKRGTVTAGDYIFFAYYRTLSDINRADIVSDRVSYIVLRGRWLNIFVLNVHVPSKKKIYDSKDSFYEQLEQVFDHFPKCHTQNLLGDFNENWGERIFSNRQLGMRVYIRIVKIMVLEQ
jgi:hypothetical protein